MHIEEHKSNKERIFHMEFYHLAGTFIDLLGIQSVTSFNGCEKDKQKHKNI